MVKFMGKKMETSVERTSGQKVEAQRTKEMSALEYESGATGTLVT